MLSDYGIDNVGVKISDKSEIHSIVPPFIAHTGDDFVIVEKIEKNDIRVLVNGYRLPDNFKIEDIRYVSEMDIK